MKRSAAPAGEKRCAWEKGRRERPVTTDAVLCYGGSHHRTPFLWDGKRLAPYVTYTDEEGREQWLFDGFIFLEFVDASRPDGRTYASVSYTHLDVYKRQGVGHAAGDTDIPVGPRLQIGGRTQHALAAHVEQEQGAHAVIVGEYAVVGLSLIHI